PQGPPGPAGTGGVNGGPKIYASGRFTGPDGVTRIFFELWGAGGKRAQALRTGSGGGGGGAFTASVINNAPRRAVQCSGGASSWPRFGNPVGPDGGDTELVAPDGTVALFAGGGKGGTGVGTSDSVSTCSGAQLPGGAGGSADPQAMVRHAGASGQDGRSCGLNTVCSPGPFGQTCSTVTTPGSVGAPPPPTIGLSSASPLISVANGYALVFW